MAAAREFGVCQCCFGHNNCLNMMVRYLHAGVIENYAEMLMETFSVNVVSSTTDSKPLICSECMLRLRDAHAFRAQLQHAQVRFRELAEYIQREQEVYPEIVKVESWGGNDADPLEATSSDDPSQGEGDIETYGQCDRGSKAEAVVYVDKIFICEICKKCFDKKANLTEHIKGCNISSSENNITEKPSKPTVYTCEYCNVAFSKARRLKHHIRTHTGEKPYICKYCNAGFTRNTSLKDHMKTHTGEKPHACHYCKKSFRKNYHLTRHVMIHTGEKSYTCKYCNASFNQSNHLDVHVRLHTGEKPYVCRYCKADFKQHAQLKRHLLTHTGGKPICDLCKLEFNQISDLRRHLKIHSGEKPFTCKYCKKSFYERSKLNRHLKIHSGEKPFTCK